MRFLVAMILVLLAALPTVASDGPDLLRPWDGTPPLEEVARAYGLSPDRLAQANPELQGPETPVCLRIPAPPGGWARHRVRRGETLWALSQRFEVDLPDLRRLNGLTGDDLRADQELLLPRPPQAWVPPAWLAVTLPDGRRGWVPGAAVLLPAASPQPRARVLELARSLQGAPYRFGGCSPDALDCSGFVQEVFRMAGHPLPRLADEQFQATLPLDRNELEAGDLVFFTTDLPGPSHVGIYAGQGRFLHASSSRGVTEDELDSGWFSTRFLGGRRLQEWTPAPRSGDPTSAR